MSTRTTQAQAESAIRRVVDHIAAERFTGVLRVRAREADGELWFLAGIEEDARFGMSKGKEAIDRMMRATDPVFEAEQRLPGLAGGFKKALSPTGSFAEVQPVDLMRYCEMFALTCVLDLVGKDRQARLTYRTGELLSADTASGGDEVLASLLESHDGTYQFELPAFDLPPGVNRPRISLRPGAPPGMVTAPAGTAVAAAKSSLAERVDLSLAGEGGEAARRENAAEAQRRADADAARLKAEADAETRRQGETRQRYEDERQVEARRRAQEREAEARRRAQEEREVAERRRDAEDREAEARRQAEAREAEARRAEEEREADARRTEEEQVAEERRREEERDAEERQKAAEEREAEEQRRAEAKRATEPKREPHRPREVGRRPTAAMTQRGRPASTPVPPPRTLQWLWLLLALAAIVVANYFLRKIH